MKRKQLMVLRILAGTAGAAILVFLALVAFSFLGNPVTTFISGQKMQSYIDRHFSFLDLEKEKVFYNFKTGNYTMRVQDTRSRDTHFSVYYNPRTKETGDTYAYDVLDGTNTIMRLEEEYALLLKSLLQDALIQGESDYQLVSVQVIDEQRWNGENPEIPPLDAPFEKNLLKGARIAVTLDAPDFPGNPAGAAGQMQQIYTVLRQNGDSFSEYTLYLEYSTQQSDGEVPYLSGITGVSPKDLENPSFPQRTQELVEKQRAEMPDIPACYADFNPEGSYPEKTKKLS